MRGYCVLLSKKLCMYVAIDGVCVGVFVAVCACEDLYLCGPVRGYGSIIEGLSVEVLSVRV